MKRTLLFFVSLFVMTLSAMAGDVVLSWSSAADWQTDADKNISLTKDGYTLSLVKVSGNNPPVVNANSNDARLYSTGTFTLSSTNGNMTKVVIKVSSSGAKRLAEYAASTGTAVVDKNALTVTWTGDAAEFTLTVEGKAVNGTDSDKAAQLCFDNVTIVDASAGGDQGGGDQGGGNEPTEELQNVFTESFAAGQGDFTIEDKVLPEGLTYVWAHNNKNGTYMKASAYKKPTAYAAESWLVSPVIDLSNATACQLSVQQAANYFKNQDNVLAALSVKVKEADAADWTDLTLSAWPAGTNWTFVEGTADLAAYDGKQIQVAFVYTSTAEIAGTYEVKDFVVRGKTDTPEPEPEVTTYNSLSELAGAATTAATPFVLNLNNVVVAGVGQR
ncbi:MAG: choice-of-anchor J domain-containing protein, partial [Bacteroidales bacterium]|nr:choice-of-anchor J domain-containing protein [Bacteroidales bacterium]